MQVVAALGLEGLNLIALAGSAIASIFDDTALPPAFQTLSRADYYGNIEVDAQAGLAGSGLRINLERATRKDYENIARALDICTEAQVALIAEVELGWQAAKWLGIIPIGKDSTPEGLHKVGRFVITEVNATVDGPQLRLQLEGRDYITHVLSETRLTDALPSADFAEAARGILDHVGLGDFIEPTEPLISLSSFMADGPRDPAVTLDIGRPALEALREMSAGLEITANKHGRDAILLRGGRVYIGTDRDIPPDGNEAIPALTVAGGLLSCKVVGRRPKDPAFSFAEADEDARPPMRRVFRVELIGAPDILVGDVMRVAPNPADARETSVGALGIETETVTLYVSALVHHLGKNQGFITTLTCVEIDPDSSAPDAIWDVHSRAPSPDGDLLETEIDDGTPESALALEVSQLIERRMRRRAWPNVAEVRAHTTSPDDEVFFTSQVLRGLIDSRQPENQISFGSIARNLNNTLNAVPYTTPFAWGRFGQVLPRYPGMRVLLSYRGGARRDPVDVGAVWHQHEGSDSAGPGGAHSGDWWLSLPAGVPDGYGAATDLSEPIMPPAEAKAANDLTDAAGNRTIEVGQFVIRVGNAALGDQGVRPGAAETSEAQAVVIHQKDGGAKIVLDKDGNITITGKQIKFDADEVEFSVSGAVNVVKS